MISFNKDKSDEIISELKEMFYAESIHICPDENEASALAVSALDDFLESYPMFFKWDSSRLYN
jgi:hypothetical protein